MEWVLERENKNSCFYRFVESLLGEGSSEFAISGVGVSVSRTNDAEELERADNANCWDNMT